VLDALWDLVWTGEVTNDTLAPLRAFLWGKARRRTAPPALPAASPPAGSGRWYLVADLLAEPPAAERMAAAWADQLLERHGIVTRDAVLAEGVAGGFAGLYPVLTAMDDAGKVRRGYFVEGLGGAQFAWPGVIDRLRRVRDEGGADDVVILSAIDPANPYGWLLPWPEFRDEAARGARRIAGAAVVLVGGAPVLYLDRGGRRLRTLAAASREDVARAVSALPELARRRPRRTLLIDVVDGAHATGSELAPVLRDAGFTRESLSLRLHAR
jgi:ATP-dependent Lhr-like helicase